MSFIDKTKENIGKGYQILGVAMPKNNKVSFWKALTKGAKGFEKWFNVITNSIAILVLFIIIFSILGSLIYFLYKLILIFI